MGLDRVILHPKAAVDPRHGAGPRYFTPQSLAVAVRFHQDTLHDVPRTLPHIVTESRGLAPGSGRIP
jgi:hypothetical protein